MPRHNNFNKGRNWNRQPDFKGQQFKSDYNEHDNRQSQGNGDFSNRRVSFKKGNRIGKHGRKDFIKNKPHFLLEEDFPMSGEGPSNRSNQMRGFRHGKGGNRNYQPPGHGYLSDQTGWFKALIPNGADYDKQILLGSLKSFVAPVELIPIYYQIEDHDSFFYIDSIKSAEAILKADKQITLNGDKRINIKVTSIMPRAALTDRLKEKIKMVMVSRYNTSTKALDLSRFHIDPELVEDSCCAVSRPPVMTVILDVIAEHIPTLQALNFDHNSLSVTETLSSLARKAPNLQILYLGNNKFHHLNALNVIKGLPLIELKLEGNPLCKRFKSKAEYESAVQKMFPKVTKLDGAELTPAISFELEERKVKLPDWHSSFLCSEEGRDLVTQFVQQYFSLYDSTDRNMRQSLADAYHDSAVFSLSAAYNSPPGQHNINRLNDYLSVARNLKRNNDPERRELLIKKGKMVIASFLTELPCTLHDPSSFTLDLSIYSPHMIIFTLTGVFKEPETKGTPHRHFFRKFVLIPVGSGFALVNDVLFVTNATSDQAKKSFQTPVAPPVAGPSPVSVAAAPNQLELIQSLSVQTGMNAEWSRKCLEETVWDLQRSLAAFTKLNQDGKIPPEAFVKIT
ncbi:nuclear RNA export factor 1-like [Neocloeon triangulifer]|uniref:nuclear RNA export factor 1-like n=1 Tax=Neocloeon triangulifer TaxID=2078957 RepID=UPI00286EC317|nr:nuclear RNA export factor 1-like [Neocloeon triangulifer]